MIEFVTSVNQAYHRNYGHRLCRGFLSYVEQPAILDVYCDGSLDVERVEPFEAYGSPTDHPPGIIRLIDLGWVNGAREFITVAEAHVFEKFGHHPSSDPDTRMIKKKYDYKWDAVKFGKKALSLIDALRHSEARYLFWIDADVVIKQRLTQDFLIGLLDGHGIVCFQREWPHTEAGFVGFDLQAPGIELWIREYSSYYYENRIFNLRDGWTDCHVFDAAVATAASEGLRVRNLSPTPRGHVMAASFLAEYLDHQKGKRRQAHKLLS